MAELIELDQNQAIKVLEDNIKVLKKCYDSDTFLILSYDLKKIYLWETDD